MRKLICIFFGHAWRVEDDFYGIDREWEIIQCKRCSKIELN